MGDDVPMGRAASLYPCWHAVAGLVVGGWVVFRRLRPMTSGALFVSRLWLRLRKG